MASKRKRQRTLITASVEWPKFVAKQFWPVKSGYATEEMAKCVASRMARIHNVDESRVKVDVQPEPKVAYKFRPGRKDGMSSVEYNEDRAEKYARWLAQRDGIVVPQGKVRFEWHGVQWQRRICAVFIADLRIEIPNWDFVPMEPVEEVAA